MVTTHYYSRAELEKLGVSFHIGDKCQLAADTKRGKWYYTIFKGRLWYLGPYKTKRTAIAAYDRVTGDVALMLKLSDGVPRS